MQGINPYNYDRLRGLYVDDASSGMHTDKIGDLSVINNKTTGNKNEGVKVESSGVLTEDVEDELLNELNATISSLESNYNAEKEGQGFGGWVAGLFGGGAEKLKTELDSKKALLKTLKDHPEKIYDIYKGITGEELTQEKINQVKASQEFAEKLSSDDKKAIVASLQKQADSLGSALDETVEGQGWFSKAIGWVNNGLDFGTSEKNSKAQIEQYKKLISQLDPDSEDFAAQYKAITGEYLSMDSAKDLLNGGSKVANSKAAESILDYEQTQTTATEIAAGVATAVVVVAAVAAAPFTGGTSLGAIALTAGFAAGVGGTTMLAIKSSNGLTSDKGYTVEQGVRDFTSGAIEGALIPVSGGIGSSVTSALGKTALSTTAKVVISGAASGATYGGIYSGGNYIAQTAGTESFSWETLGETTLTGTLSGTVAGGVAGGVNTFVRPALTSGETAVSQVTGRLISGGVTGLAAGTTGGAIAGGTSYLFNADGEEITFEGWLDATLSGAETGAVTGFAAGVTFEAVNIAAGAPKPEGTVKIEEETLENGLNVKNYYDKDGNVIASDIKASDFAKLQAEKTGSAIATQESTTALSSETQQVQNLAVRTIRMNYSPTQTQTIMQNGTEYTMSAKTGSPSLYEWNGNFTSSGVSKLFVEITQKPQTQYVENPLLGEGSQMMIASPFNNTQSLSIPLNELNLLRLQSQGINVPVVNNASALADSTGIAAEVAAANPAAALSSVNNPISSTPSIQANTLSLKDAKINVIDKGNEGFGQRYKYTVDLPDGTSLAQMHTQNIPDGANGLYLVDLPEDYVLSSDGFSTTLKSHVNVPVLASTGGLNPEAEAQLLAQVVKDSINVGSEGRIIIKTPDVDPEDSSIPFLYKELGLKFTSEAKNQIMEKWLQEGGEFPAKLVGSNMYLPKENVNNVLKYGNNPVGIKDPTQNISTTASPTSLTGEAALRAQAFDKYFSQYTPQDASDLINHFSSTTSNEMFNSVDKLKQNFPWEKVGDILPHLSSDRAQRSFSLLIETWNPQLNEIQSFDGIRQLINDGAIKRSDSDAIVNLIRNYSDKLCNKFGKLCNLKKADGDDLFSSQDLIMLLQMSPELNADKFLESYNNVFNDPEINNMETSQLIMASMLEPQEIINAKNILKNPAFASFEMNDVIGLGKIDINTLSQEDASKLANVVKLIKNNYAIVDFTFIKNNDQLTTMFDNMSYFDKETLNKFGYTGLFHKLSSIDASTAQNVSMQINTLMPELKDEFANIVEEQGIMAFNSLNTFNKITPEIWDKLFKGSSELLNAFAQANQTKGLDFLMSLSYRDLAKLSTNVEVKIMNTPNPVEKGASERIRSLGSTEVKELMKAFGKLSGTNSDYDEDMAAYIVTRGNVDIKAFNEYINNIDMQELIQIEPRIANFTTQNLIDFLDYHFRNGTTEFNSEELTYTGDLTSHLQSNLLGTVELSQLLSAFPSTDRSIGQLPSDWLNGTSQNNQSQISDEVYKAISNFQNTNDQAQLESELSNILGKTVTTKDLGSGMYGRGYKISIDGCKDVVLKVYKPDNKLINVHGQYFEPQTAIYATANSNNFANAYFGKVANNMDNDGFIVTEFLSNDNNTTTDSKLHNTEYISTIDVAPEIGHNYLGGKIIDFGAAYVKTPELSDTNVRNSYNYITEHLEQGTNPYNEDKTLWISPENLEGLKSYIEAQPDKAAAFDALTLLDKEYNSDMTSVLEGQLADIKLDIIKSTNPEIENPEAYLMAIELQNAFATAQGNPTYKLNDSTADLSGILKTYNSIVNYSEFGMPTYKATVCALNNMVNDLLVNAVKTNTSDVTMMGILENIMMTTGSKNITIENFMTSNGSRYFTDAQLDVLSDFALKNGIKLKIVK